MPIMVNGLFSHFIILPTVFLKPKNLAADSLMIKAAESVAKSLEKSRPSSIFQFTVLPNSYDTALFGKSTAILGSLPSQLKPPLLFHTCVKGLMEPAISSIACEFFNSVRIAS